MGKSKQDGRKSKPPVVPQAPKVLVWAPPDPSPAKLLYARETNSISVYAPKTGGYKIRRGA